MTSADLVAQHTISTADYPRSDWRRIIAFGASAGDCTLPGLIRYAQVSAAANDHALMARAAVRYALPTDWYSGDERAAELLASVSEQPLETADHVAVTAARALAEMRVPLVETSGQQVASVTRPGVAQPLANDALARSVGLPTEVRLLALLAWRSTHRSPEHLAQRREISEEAFNLAQRLRDPSFQVDAGVWAAVDAAEAGDRGAYDRAVALVRWIAERDGNPRLRWRALSLWAGQVMLDGDLNTAVTVRHEAAALAQDAHLPGWVASDMFIAGQLIITQDEPDGLRLMTALDNDPLLQNPIALAGVAYAHARVGDQAVAQRMVQRAFARLGAESSMLLTATRLAATVVVLKDQGLARRLVDLLTPYQDHWSVDSHGWWIDGPVHAWLAFLHNLLDQSHATQTHAHLAIETARVFRDERSLTRLSALDIQASAAPLRGQLAPRHVEVLTLVAQGHTNGEIAEKLSFSVSTIRQTLSELFDIFRTRNRSSLVQAAQTDGLLDQARR